MAALERLPSTNCRRIGAVLYFMGDPVHVVLSLYRRKYFLPQAMKLRREVMRRRCPELGDQLRDLTLEKYAQSQLDVLGLAAHLSDWLLNACSANTDYPTIFSWRSDLWEHIDELASLLALNGSRIPATERTAFAKTHSSSEQNALPTGFFYFFFFKKKTK